ncbi:MAG: hypothetical protein EON92_07965 [Burkholderiales bacterium]|nr:MAG: hypothetical protein EON92_07965 [Burkholderiales bacterium]
MVRAFGTLIAAVIAAGSVGASIAVSIPLKELYLEATTVAVVEVLEGRVVSVGGESCGARYKSRVIEATKNASPGKILEFGYVPDLKVGASYLVLLADYDNVPVERVPEFQARCKRALPAHAMVGHWRGAMEIVGNTNNPTQRSLWTVRPAGSVIYPIGTRSNLVSGEKQLIFTDLMGRMTGEK